jgi:Icc-related predicted phosphoesterase
VDKCPNFADPNGPWVSVGDNDLAKKIRRIEPKVHVCGHVHSGYGHAILGETTYINASICNEGYFAVNKPIAFNIDTTTKNTTLIHYV